MGIMSQDDAKEKDCAGRGDIPGSHKDDVGGGGGGGG